jgi:4-hydroxybenzoate polyprenyltransferase
MNDCQQEDSGENPTERPAWKAWLQLVRLPNLLTVPGDPIAGYLLAKAAGFPGEDTRFTLLAGLSIDSPWAAAGMAAAIALFVYMAGLVDNDVADLTEDRSERPGRPLPSGQISLRAARIAFGLLAFAGLILAVASGLSSLVVAACLLTAVLVYNHAAKRIPVVGPLLMGSCRALSLLLGAAAAGWRAELSLPVLVPAVVLGLYVASVTAIAAGETRSERLGLRRWMPALVLAAGFGAMAYIADFADLAGGVRPALAGIIFALWAALLGAGLSGRPEPAVVQASIGRLIRGLLFVQLIFVAVAGAPTTAAGLTFMALWFLQIRLAGWFYST